MVNEHRDIVERGRIRKELGLKKEWQVDFWPASGHGDKPRFVLQSSTHTGDLVLELNGDFGTEEYQRFVADELCALLNKVENVTYKLSLISDGK